MDSSRFRNGISVRIGALVLTIAVIAWMIDRTQWYMAITLCAVVIIAQVVMLTEFATQSSREVARFLAGRADTYVNDVNTVDQAVKANPDKLEKALAVTIPYSVGIAVPKDKPEFRDAVLAALIEVQKAGIHMDLLKKWELDVNNFKEPDILSVK